jgi:hypothetical protein
MLHSLGPKIQQEQAEASRLAAQVLVLRGSMVTDLVALNCVRSILGLTSSYSSFIIEAERKCGCSSELLQTSLVMDRHKARRTLVEKGRSIRGHFFSSCKTDF